MNKAILFSDADVLTSFYFQFEFFSKNDIGGWNWFWKKVNQVHSRVIYIKLLISGVISISAALQWQHNFSPWQVDWAGSGRFSMLLSGISSNLQCIWTGEISEKYAWHCTNIKCLAIVNCKLGWQSAFSSSSYSLKYVLSFWHQFSKIFFSSAWEKWQKCKSSWVTSWDN